MKTSARKAKRRRGKDMWKALRSAAALNAAWKYGVAAGQRRSALTIEQSASILDRSERGRAVGRELYAFLTGRAMALDTDGKTAVLALIEEAFICRPGSVADALADFVEDRQ